MGKRTELRLIKVKWQKRANSKRDKKINENWKTIKINKKYSISFPLSRFINHTTRVPQLNSLSLGAGSHWMTILRSMFLAVTSSSLPALNSDNCSVVKDFDLLISGRRQATTGNRQPENMRLARGFERPEWKTKQNWTHRWRRQGRENTSKAAGFAAVSAAADVSAFQRSSKDPKSGSARLSSALNLSGGPCPSVAALPIPFRDEIRVVRVVGN